MRGALLGLVLAGLAPAAGAETLLQLSEQGRVAAHPDELAASLAAEAEAPSAAAAQDRVNTMVKAALARIAQTDGIVGTTGAYTVWHSTPPERDRWQARQTLDLHGKDGPGLLAVVGELQGRGLALNQMVWRLSAETSRTAQAQATRQALAGLRARAEDAASALGLRFGEFRSVRIDGTDDPVRPIPGPRMMMTAIAPPVAAGEDVTVSATVAAEATLLAR